jgi:macrolide-specific efflux system membrane fusion protein
MTLTAYLPVLIALVLLAGADSSQHDTLSVSDVQVTLIADVQAPARQDGVLAVLVVKEGDLVAQNAELGRLDNELASIEKRLAMIEFEISRAHADNDIDRRFAKKSLEVAKSELARSLESVTNFPKSISQTELDRLRLVVEKTDLSIEQSDRDLKEAGLTKTLKEEHVEAAAKQLNDHQITAPITGMVVQVYRQAGEWLNRGDPVVRIIRLNRLRVEAFVDGARYGADLNGCPVTFTTQLPPGNVVGTFQGKITFVSPEVQPVNGQVRIWAEVDNPQLLLRPGALGTLTIDRVKKPLSSTSTRMSDVGVQPAKVTEQRAGAAKAVPAASQ